MEIGLILLVLGLLASALCAAGAETSIVHGEVKIPSNQQAREFPRSDWTEKRIQDLFFKSRELQEAYGLRCGGDSNFGRLEAGVYVPVFLDFSMRNANDAEFAQAYLRFLTRTRQGGYDVPAIDERDHRAGSTVVKGHPSQFSATKDGLATQPGKDDSGQWRTAGDGKDVGGPEPTKAEPEKVTPYIRDGEWCVDVAGKTYLLADAGAPGSGMPLPAYERDGQEYVKVAGVEYPISKVAAKARKLDARF